MDEAQKEISFGLQTGDTARRLSISRGANLYDRLLQYPTGHNYGNIDAFNAHVGLAAGRYLTGITDDKQGFYGPNTYGVFADYERGTRGIPGKDLDDRLIMMFQPLILTLRCFNKPKDPSTISEFEAVDASGNPDYPLLFNYFPVGTVEDGKWINRFREMYKALQEFCEQRQEWEWLLTENIVEKTESLQTRNLKLFK